MGVWQASPLLLLLLLTISAAGLPLGAH
ncbi:hypothetical protein CRUP_000319, partial [Coryphaenoides rupestris]